MRHSTKATTTTMTQRFAKRLDRAAVAHVTNVRVNRLVPVCLSSLGGQGRPVQPGEQRLAIAEAMYSACSPESWHGARPKVSRRGSLLA